MAKGRGTGLAVLALAIYVMGGVGTFAGLALLAFVRHRDLWGLGSGTSIGILLVVTGLILSIVGVLVMRIFRNRRLL